MRPTFDERDAELTRKRLALMNQVEGPRVGDWVDFADGVSRRISYMWPDSVQTSNEGYGFYLGPGYVSFSGTLYRGVPPDTLTPTGETREGRVWLFHHGHTQAHNGVETSAPFRVFKCSLPSSEV